MKMKISVRNLLNPSELHAKMAAPMKFRKNDRKIIQKSALNCIGNLSSSNVLLVLCRTIVRQWSYLLDSIIWNN